MPRLVAVRRLLSRRIRPPKKIDICFGDRLSQILLAQAGFISMPFEKCPQIEQFCLRIIANKIYDKEIFTLTPVRASWYIIQNPPPSTGMYVAYPERLLGAFCPSFEGTP